VGLQGDAQTGNAQNLTALTQGNGVADEFELEEVGSDITGSPSNTTTCTDQVNQAAAASWTPASSTATGVLEAARGTLPLVTLGALALISTAGIAIRRNRRHNSKG